MTLYRIDFQSPLGRVFAQGTQDHLLRISFEPVSGEVRATPVFQQLEKEFSEYFSGKRTVFTLPLVLEGTLFQRSVWEALQKIPFGKTISYEELACWVGCPRGCRAVAQANRKNPFPIVIPCHRVIQKDGSLGGYYYSVSLKQALLDHERGVCS